MKRALLPLIVVFAMVAVACAGNSDTDDEGATVSAGDDASSATTTTDGAGAADEPLGEVSERYADMDLWHCHPDKADDVCDTTPLGADQVLPDNSIVPIAYEPAADPPIDCFYVYPTVDLFSDPGNRSFDEEINPLELIVTAGQVARFSEVCRLFVPRYEQMTISGYDDENFDEYFDRATAQVTEAFNDYLATANNGRPFVLIGHSQGSHHLTRMIASEIDDNPALRDLMVSALLIGPTGWVQVPEGEVVGGTFENIELCTAADQTGCVIAFDSYGEDQQPARKASEDDTVSACVNPADLIDRYTATESGTGTPVSNGSYFGATTEGVTNAYELWTDYYTATCTISDTGDQYLEIGTAAGDDARTELQLSGNAAESLHRLDINFALRDLIEIVRIQSGQE